MNMLLFTLITISILQGCLGLTEKEVTNVIRKTRSTVKPQLATMVRLSFHDCVGGCDGCINIENDSNNGLADLVADLETVYQNNGFESVLSRADMWAILGVWAVQQTIDNSNSNGINVPDLAINYTFGRVDCETAPYSSDVEKFPSSTFNYQEIMSFFSEEFGFSPLEVTALMGAHTLGNAEITNSGFHGTWVQGEAGQFNNKYYSNMLVDAGVDWKLRQRPCTKLVDSSLCSDGQTTGWQYFASGTGFNLVADMALVQDFSVSQDGKPDCDYSSCDLSDSYSDVEDLAASNDYFIQEFGKVYEKVLSHKCDNLQFVQ